LKKSSLGIDCSARSTGVVLITSSHKYNFTLITPKGLREGARLTHIYERLEEFLRGKLIDVAIMESPSYNSTNRPFTLGEVHGVIKLCLSKRGIPLYGVAPKALKKYATGKGTAKKADMASAASGYGCPTQQFDVTDAWFAAMLGVDALLDECTPGKRASYEVVNDIREKINA